MAPRHAAIIKEGTRPGNELPEVNLEAPEVEAGERRDPWRILRRFDGRKANPEAAGDAKRPERTLEDHQEAAERRKSGTMAKDDTSEHEKD